MRLNIRWFSHGVWRLQTSPLQLLYQSSAAAT
jgi:hypothetical protein